MVWLSRLLLSACCLLPVACCLLPCLELQTVKSLVTQTTPTMDDETNPVDVLRVLVAADLVSVGWDADVDEFFFYLDDEQQKRMDEVDESTWSDY